MDKKLISITDPNYQILKRVTEYPATGKEFICEDSIKIAIVDLETTGLDYIMDKITEIGVIIAAFDSHNEAVDIVGTYQAFNDPGVPISERITELTGITDDMVKGQSIDWAEVSHIIQDVNYVVCHNAAFDRKFLEAAYNNNVVFEQCGFACTKNDIDWSARGYGASKLDYLNWKLGYFYDGHRAINDCWATLNLLVQEEGALAELLKNAGKSTYEVYAVDAPYYTKDKLKNAGYWWNDGNNGKPKAWYKVVEDQLKEYYWLLGENICKTTKYYEINATNRYSSRDVPSKIM